jgi:SAM-dependent methyltransferase
MSDINGYVTDQEYTSNYYQGYTPAYLDYVALLNGVAPPERPAGQFRLCDLGCGFGMTALALAAANPAAQVYGIDYMAEHIDVSCDLAKRAGINNAYFLQLSFAQALEKDFEPFDYIVAHGVYTWVNADVRAEVLAFIKRFLKPGGIAYLSYNSLPGKATIMPVQKLVSHFGALSSGRAGDRVLGAFAKVGELKQMGARALQDKPAVDMLLDSLKDEDPRYLAHEYLHSTWEPRYSIDVAAEMAMAGTEFIGSATLFANDERFLLTPEQRAYLAGFENINQRELVKDFLLDVPFRRDIYANSPRRLDAAEQERRLGKLMLMLAVAADAVDYTVKVAFVEASIDSPIARNIVKALASGPKTINQLLSRWDMMSASVQEVRDVVFMLLCSQQLTLVEQDKVATASRLNEVLRDAGYVCNALVTPYGVALEMQLAELMLALGAPQGDRAERANWLRNESQRLGRALRDSNKQRLAEDAGEDAYAALVDDFDRRRAGLLTQWLPVGHI